MVKVNKKTENQNQALGYCRVSTDDQADKGLSLDYQETQCREQALKDGYENIIIIRDEGKSGTSIIKRKGIQKVIELSKNKEISTFYVTNSDRLARNTLDHSFLRNIFRENNVKLKYLNGQSSGDDAGSIMADNMFASVNQYHSDLTREKTQQATNTKAQAGYLPTHAPTGYINTTNPDKNCEKVAKKIIIPNPETGQLVTETFKLYATGQYNVYELNDLMNKKGLVSNTGKKLSPSMVYAMLRNRLYLGEIHWKEIHVKEGKHKPLVDYKTFDQVQSVLNERTGNRCKRRKYFWLLNGYIFCPIHNRRYTAEWHLNKSRAYYHCPIGGGCSKYIEKSDLEEQVANKFKNIEFDSEIIELIIKKVEEIFRERKYNYDKKYRGFLNQKNAWNAKLKTAENRLLDNTIEGEDYLRIKKEIIEAINKLNSSINNLERTKEVNIDVLSEILLFTKDIYNTYRESPENIQKQIIGFFYNGFEVKNGIIIKERYSLLFQELIRLKSINFKSQDLNKPLENKGKSEVIINTILGGYRESNPNQRNHNPLC